MFVLQYVHTCTYHVYTCMYMCRSVHTCMYMFMILCTCLNHVCQLLSHSMVQQLTDMPVVQTCMYTFTLANRGGCTRCIGMYWDVFWMYQIKFGCINIPIHHRCIGMYFRGIVMYYKMYWDVFHNVLRCITILFRLTKYMPIHL